MPIKRNQDRFLPRKQLPEKKTVADRPWYRSTLAYIALCSSIAGLVGALYTVRDRLFAYEPANINVQLVIDIARNENTSNVDDLSDVRTAFEQTATSIAQSDNASLRSVGGSCDDSGTRMLRAFSRKPIKLGTELPQRSTESSTRPLLTAIIKATNDFSDAKRFAGRNNRIIVITRGEDNCITNPEQREQVAKEMEERLKLSGVTAQILFVGFRVSPFAEQRLIELAGAVKGGFKLVGDPKGLSKVLKTARSNDTSDLFNNTVIASSAVSYASPAASASADASASNSTPPKKVIPPLRFVASSGINGVANEISECIDFWAWDLRRLESAYARKRKRALIGSEDQEFSDCIERPLRRLRTLLERQDAHALAVLAPATGSQYTAAVLSLDSLDSYVSPFVKSYGQLVSIDDRLQINLRKLQEQREIILTGAIRARSRTLGNIDSSMLSEAIGVLQWGPFVEQRYLLLPRLFEVLGQPQSSLDIYNRANSIVYDLEVQSYAEAARLTLLTDPDDSKAAARLARSGDDGFLRANSYLNKLLELRLKFAKP